MFNTYTLIYKNPGKYLMISSQKLFFNKEFFMDNICYTVISGPYDKLKTPTTISKGWRYICFTDQNIVSNIWEIRPIPGELNYLSQVKRQRCLKTQPHRFLPEHEWSVYVDANITIRVGMWKLVRDICKREDFSVTKHPERDCIYVERGKCLALKKDDGVESEEQIKRYQKEGFPTHFGLNETGLLVRHNVDWVKTLDDMWWNEIEKGSHRDQLSFNYCLWKGGFMVNNLDKMLVRKSENFIYSVHKTSVNKDRVNLVIIHYNTPELTEALYHSICKFTPNSTVYIFDNSNMRPFPYKKFPKIHHIDNTKGQIIDFDKWLEGYPKKNASAGKVNGWGSAKHCVSVEKCMELIKDEFILLDSDILLKKDISTIVDNKKVYSGEVIVQPRSTIKRILPFICYINTPFCIKNNVHYFDPNYMHGLWYNVKNPTADSYDTGAGFYMNAKPYPHKDIKSEDYMVHLGGGSWIEEKNKKLNRKITPTEWLEKYKNLYI